MIMLAAATLMFAPIGVQVVAAPSCLGLGYN